MTMRNEPDSTLPDGEGNLLRDAIEALSEGFALYDANRRLVLFNERYREMNHAVADILEPGLDWEILMRESARRGVYAEAVGKEDRFVRDRLENGIEFIKDYELVQSDGTVSLVSVHPIDGGGFAITRSDVTEDRRVQEKERENDLLLRTVLDASSSATTMVRLGDGQILYRTPAALELFGNTKFATDHYTNKVDRADFITQLLADGQVDDYRVTLINSDGNPFPASLSARIVEYKGEEVAVTSTVDLTEQIRAQALIRQVLEACPVPVQMTKVGTGEVLFSSPETTALFGMIENAKSYYSSEEDRRSYVELLRSTGKVDAYRVELINSHGRPFQAAVSSRLIDFQGEQVIVSNTRDLTDDIALQREIDDQREMLFQNEKMSALGELLAGVAHELNNPLSVVVGHSLMLREDITDQEVLKRVDKISSAAERCAKIVKTFLAMARQQPTKMEETDVNAVIDTAVDVAQIGMKSRDLTIRSKKALNLPSVSVDIDQITQVIINLIINAEQAIIASNQGGTVTVSTNLQDSGNFVEIQVEDDGPGIAEKIRPRIFEPFFTTKEVGDGTGIGLALCHRIVMSHSGQIELDDDYTSGTRFIIRLPVSEKPVLEKHNPQEEGAERGRCVLVVDDEIDVGELLQEMLMNQGFDAVFVSTANEALALLKTRKFDAVLSDVNMPGMDGRGFYEALRASAPNMIQRLAFITGDTMGKSSQSLLQDAGRPHLEKPVSPTELRKLVHGLLKSAGSLDNRG